MKTCLYLLFTLLAAPLSISAQSFSIPWFTLDGGGGTSTGAVYSLSGTIGQPDAGRPMTNGLYSLVGGFWSTPSVIQTVGAPLLSIESLGGGTVRVYWPRPATGFQLEQTTVLASQPANTVWTPAPAPYQTNATHISITAPNALASRVYRLHQP